MKGEVRCPHGIPAGYLCEVCGGEYSLRHPTREEPYMKKPVDRQLEKKPVITRWLNPAGHAGRIAKELLQRVAFRVRVRQRRST